MDDLISRQALLAEYDRLHVGEPGMARKMIKDAPSAQPERKTGKWIRVIDGFECSNCECLVEEEREPLYDFCPSCGADMRGDET